MVGLALAGVALHLLIALAPAGLPRINDIGIDLAALVFALVVALLTSFLFGLVPVLRFAAIRVVHTEPGRTVSPSHERHRARNFFVIVQVALALVLLVFSGLMIRTFRALTEVSPGFVRPTEC